MGNGMRLRYHFPAPSPLGGEGWGEGFGSD